MYLLTVWLPLLFELSSVAKWHDFSVGNRTEHHLLDRDDRRIMTFRAGGEVPLRH